MLVILLGLGPVRGVRRGGRRSVLGVVGSGYDTGGDDVVVGKNRVGTTSGSTFGPAVPVLPFPENFTFENCFYCYFVRSIFYNVIIRYSKFYSEIFFYGYKFMKFGKKYRSTF